MKKALILAVVLVMLVSLTACDKIQLAEVEKTAIATQNNKTQFDSQTAQSENEIEAQQEVVKAESTPEVSKEPEPTESPEAERPQPEGNPNMYSSHAHLVEYDTETGWAKFDYFEIMTGDEAIDALMVYEGYDLASAQVEVMSWEEGGYYEKNTNPQLRTVDLGNAEVRMIVKTDGTLIDDIGNPPLYELSDINALYDANPIFIIDYFDYFVTVDDKGTVTKVEQVYRP